MHAGLSTNLAIGARPGAISMTSRPPQFFKASKNCVKSSAILLICCFFSRRVMMLRQAKWRPFKISSTVIVSRIFLYMASDPTAKTISRHGYCRVKRHKTKHEKDEHKNDNSQRSRHLNRPLSLLSGIALNQNCTPDVVPVNQRQFLFQKLIFCPQPKNLPFL